MSNGSSSSEFLSYETVKSTMGDLNLIFSEYYKLVDTIDTMIENSFNAGTESALSSKLGEDFLNKWNSAAATFNNFKTKFENYYNDVMKVTETTSGMESAAAALISQITDEVADAVSDVTAKL